MPGVNCSEPEPCIAEWLAGISTQHEVHFTAKVSPREGFKIRPDRCWIQNTRFHARQKVFDSKGFDLHISNGSERSNSSLNSSFDAADTGTAG